MREISKTTARAALFVLLAPVLVINAWCGIRTYQLVSQEAVIKQDYAFINSIRNGLLSVDVWKTHIRNILSDRITTLSFTPQQEADLKSELEKVLASLIVEAQKVMNKPQKTFREKMKMAALKAFMDTPALNKEIPQFAQTILDEIEKPRNLEKLKRVALSQLNNYAEQTHDNETDRSSVQEILAKYHSKNAEEFNSRTAQLLNELQKRIRLFVWAMIGSLLLYVLSWGVARKQPELYAPLFVLSVALVLIVLLSSLSLPLIDIDARIRNVDFQLLGEHLQFNDQLLYYRSKSIMQMVRILVVSREADSVFVGFLILLFSILFPISKLACSLYVLWRGGARQKPNKLIHFFAYQSGKWSMADVMVVAMFMAYIGFNSILDAQLKDLNKQFETLQIVATNETSLQPGFTLFIAFVISGLGLSEILKKIMPERSVSP